MRPHLIFATAILLGAVFCAAEGRAQSSPGFYNGQVPTAGQWNAAFAGKQDYNPNFFATAYTWTAPQTWSAQAIFNGHVSFGAVNSPAVSACGTSPSIVGSDNAGEVTTGTGSPTSCTITFATAYAVQPVCIVRDRTATTTINSYTISTTALVVTTSAASSQKLDYICVGA
jgi:hypothetical protein